MSKIPTKHIDGDVGIGRNVVAGGDATVRGNVTVGHNLKVEGWLEAANIKGVNKGLFSTAVLLEESYPVPEEGWWAIVGDTLPGDVYVCEGGRWVATGKKGGSAELDSNKYETALGEIQSWISDVDRDIGLLEAQCKELRKETKNALRETATLRQDMSDLSAGFKQAGAAMSGISAKIASMDGSLTSLRQITERNDAEIQQLYESVSQFNGVIDEKGEIKAVYLPSDIRKILQVAREVDYVPDTEKRSSAKSSADDGCRVIYCKTKKCFLLEEGTLLTKYYTNWADAKTYGTVWTHGVEPRAGVLFYMALTVGFRYWDGKDLKDIGNAGGNSDLTEESLLKVPVITSLRRAIGRSPATLTRGIIPLRAERGRIYRDIGEIRVNFAKKGSTGELLEDEIDLKDYISPGLLPYIRYVDHISYPSVFTYNEEDRLLRITEAKSKGSLKKPQGLCAKTRLQLASPPGVSYLWCDPRSGLIEAYSGVPVESAYASPHLSENGNDAGLITQSNRWDWSRIELERMSKRKGKIAKWTRVSRSRFEAYRFGLYRVRYKDGKGRFSAWVVFTCRVKTAGSGHYRRL